MQLPVIPLVAILIFTVPADGHIDFDPKHTQEGGTCLHDKFQAKNLPYIQRKADKPFKREDTKYAPIRVHTVVDDSVTKFPEFAIIGDSNGPLFSAINVLSHALLGRRIPGNFTLPPACDEIEDGPNKGKCYSGTVSNDSFLCPELEGSLLLGMSTHFLGTREACRNETGPCQMEGPNGYGDDIDYFLQVVSFEAFCSPGAIAAALACAQDDFHRPAFGIIFICPSNFRTLITYEQQFNVLIHELTHAFGFSDNLFDSFHDGELNFYNATDIFEYNGEPILGLTSPKLLEVAREYFDCPNLEYVPLENGGGSGSANSHWEARVLTHEIMGAFIIEDYQVYSNFTWALFEDSGWYKVNYTVTSQLSARQFNLTWGRGLGCGFVLQSCNNPQTYPYLCDVTEGYRQCTPDLLTKSICPSSSRFYDGCMVPAIADATDTCLSFVNISGGPLLQTQDTRSRCFRFTTNQCDYEPICLTVTIVKEPQSGLLAYYVTISGTDVWCRENEVIEHRGLFLECPPITTLLLHYDRHTIITPNQIPPPLCHKSCATCSAVNVSDKCLTCNEGQSLQGPPPSSCAGRINSTGQEQGCVCQRGQVQLLPGVFIRAVVVCINNQHTAICANNWDARDAAVVCRHFRLFGGFPFVINIPASPSLLSNPRCIGNETNLLSCEINDDSNCNDTEKAGIYCFPFPDFCTHGDVRITNFGIEICINDVWGSICSENFNEIEATVFCKQLGFPNGISLNSTYRYTSLNYGQFKCNGTESSLLECSIVTIGDCIPAAVRCYDFPCNHGDVRLVDGRNQSHGRVEVCVLDVWGTVCDDSWDDKDARVVCRQLGYPFGRSVGNNVKSGSLFQPIYLDDVNCNGTETSLLNCPHNGIGQHNCGHFEDAGVVCLDVISCNHGDLRLVDGRNQSHGRVEICVLDIWGTVCDDSWNDRDARVVCRQLGYHYGWSDNSVKSGNQSQPIYLDDVNCIGTETSLLHCSHNGIGQHNCRHFEDVGVVCSDLIPCNYGDVRLVDGNNKFHGRVEVCALDVWGTVCENSWDDRDAQVVCRQLGYHSGRSVSVKSGSESQLIFLDNVNCNGTETNLLNCSHNGIGQHNCDHSDDVGVLCSDIEPSCNYGDVRLVDGRNQSEGRVEICAFDVWGTVCDDSWDDRDARVVCRQLGYTYGWSGNDVKSGFQFQPIHLDDVNCDGTETSLLNCSHNGIGQHNCDHSEDTGVICSDVIPCNHGDVRLVDGLNQFQGRVEVCALDIWGTVCDDSWDNRDAQVVCRQLGYPSGWSIGNGVNSGRLSQLIHLDDVNCNGTETSFLNCSHNGIGQHNCFHSDDAGVLCSDVEPSCNYGDVRLVDGRNQSHGRVEICVFGIWGTVCDDRWDNRDARVVCRQLGHISGISVGNNVKSGNQSQPIYLDNVNCIGTETSLLHCSHNGIGQHNCDHFEDAGVICSDEIICNYGDVRLVDGINQFYGRVEVCVLNVWGTVCDDSWDNRDAQVVCRQLGYHYGWSIGNGVKPGSFYQPIYLDDVNCNGTETSLLNCSHNGIGQHNCDHFKHDVGVVCSDVEPSCNYGDVRLVDGRNQSHGRVEICAFDVWGTVCADNWDDKDAQVVCSQLGYTSGISINNNVKSGNQFQPIYLDDVNCIGTETSLINCSHNGIGQHDCGHLEDAGVVCSDTTTLTPSPSPSPTPSSTPFPSPSPTPSPTPTPSQCFNTGQVVLQHYSTAYFFNSSVYITGQVSICFDGQYIPICNRPFEYSLFPQVCAVYTKNPESVLLPGLILGNFSDYQPFVYSGRAIAILTCPLVYNFSDCWYYLEEEDGCGPYGGHAAITCHIPPPPKCYEGSLNIGNHTTFSFPNGLAGERGRLEVCYEGEFVDICSETSVNFDADNAISTLCRNRGYSFGYITEYDPDYSTSDSGLYITDIECPSQPYNNLHGCNITEGICTKNPLSILCIRVCRDGSVRILHDNATVEYLKSEGNVTITGVVEVCVLGTWASVCDRYHIDPTAADIVCKELGYLGGYSLPANVSIYGSSDSSLVISNIRCSCNFYRCSINDCSYDLISNDSDCTNHNRDALVSCYNTDRSCYGNSHRLNKPGRGLLSNGIPYAIGPVQLCINSTYATVCNKGLNAYSATQLCRSIINPTSLGSPGLFGIDKNNLVYPLTPNALSDIQCPNEFFNSSACSFTFSSNNGCSDFGGDAVISCITPPTPRRCTYGNVQIFDGAIIFLNNSNRIIVGIPQICTTNDTYIPVCKESLTVDIAQRMCRQFNYDDGVLLYSYLNDIDFDKPQESRGIATIICPRFNQTLYNCTFGLSNDKCSSDGSHAVISCINYYYVTPTPSPSPTPTPACSVDGLIVLNNQSIFISQENYYITGQLSVCYGGNYLPVCNNTLREEEAKLSCSLIGATAVPGLILGSYSDYQPPFYFGQVFSHISCPTDPNTFSDCQFIIEDYYGCRDYGGDAVLTCYISIPQCSEGNLTIGNSTGSYFNFSSGFSGETGRLEVCYNGKYVDICNDVQVDFNWNNVVASFCRSRGFTYGNLTSSYQDYGSSDSGLYVSSINCSSEPSGNLKECNFIANETCSGKPLIVQCVQVCRDGSVRILYDNATVEYVEYESNVTITGVVEVCLFGTWASVCDRYHIDPTAADIICKELGYLGGQVYPTTPGSYEYSQAYLIISNINCSCDSPPCSINDCSYDIANDGYCRSHAGDVIVRCHNSHRKCNGSHLRMYRPGVGRISDGTGFSIGPVQACINSTYATVCKNELDFMSATQICRKAIAPYSYGAPGLFGNDINNFVFPLTPAGLGNISCPRESFDNVSCNFIFSDRKGCSALGGDAVISCTTNPPECQHGDLKIASLSYLRLNDESFTIIGQPEVCIGDELIPLCNASLTYETAQRFCQYYGLISIPLYSFLVDIFDFSNPKVSRAITSISCLGSDQTFKSCNFTLTDDSCTNHGSFAVVSCIPSPTTPPPTEICKDGQIRLKNNFTANFTQDNILLIYTLGLFEVCINKTFTSFCYNLNTSTHFGRLTELACHELGYTNATILSYSATNVTTPIINSVYCPRNAQHWSNCTFNTTTTRPCIDHKNDINLICFKTLRNCTHGDVRLVNGSSSLEGRVEVCINGVWGTICGSFWDDNNARVVCRQLGLSGGDGQCCGRYGPGIGPRYFEYIACSGNERRLIDCYVPSFFTVRCSHASDVGVKCRALCKEPESDLIDSNGHPLDNPTISTNSTLVGGIVEFCVKGIRNVICDNSWSFLDAMVGCRGLGYSPYGALPTGNHYLSNFPTIPLLTNLGCHGNESSLVECIANNKSRQIRCNSSNVAGLICHPKNIISNCRHGDVRLVGGDNSREGIVEICINNLWGRVCTSGWDTRAANVTCRHAGFLSQDIVYTTVYNTSLSVHSARFDCRGNESSLLDCKLYNSYCSQYWAGYVNCRAPCEEPETSLIDYNGLPLDNPTIPTNPTLVGGIIGFCIKRVRNVICDNFWSYFDAMVGCRELGYSPYGAIPTGRHYLSFFPNKPILTNLGCHGNESSLVECIANNRSRQIRCNLYNIAGLICHPKNITSNCRHGDIRLVGGKDSREGIVEICINNIWGRVCTNRWNDRTANVTCRHAGFLSQDIVYTTVYNTSLSVHSARFYCHGNESSLLDCKLYNSYCSRYWTEYVNCRAPCEEPETSLIDYNGLPLDNPTIPINPTLVGGIIEFCIKRVRNVICDNSWSYFDAMVGCRGLGYSPYGAIPTGRHHLSFFLNKPVLTNLGCHGNESSLVECIANNRSRQIRCSLYNIAGLICHPKNITSNCRHGDIRLVGGDNSREGIVEICINNLWGRVCTSGWNDRTANVTCRHAGFLSQDVVHRTVYNTILSVHSTSFDCHGNESSLLDCKLYNSYCSQYWTEYVTCRAPCVEPETDFIDSSRVPLDNPTISTDPTLVGGIVEFCIKGMRNVICDNSWSFLDAMVGCRGLGYSLYGALPTGNHYLSNFPTTPVLTNLGCHGNESSLVECIANNKSRQIRCNSSNVAGLICHPKNITSNCYHGDIRLVGDKNDKEGIVEICINNLWGRVCTSGWDTRAANVTCRHAGFLSQDIIFRRVYNTSLSVHSVRFDCHGNELSLLDCKLYNSYCPQYWAGYVNCRAPCEEPETDLIDYNGLPLDNPNISTNPTLVGGIIEFCVKGMRNIICDNSWSYFDAMVGCRGLGYSPYGALPIGSHYLSNFPTTPVLTNLGCYGNESSLVECIANNRSRQIRCSSYNVAGLICHPKNITSNCRHGDIRLVGGKNSREGIVEICINNLWGKVCTNGWNTRAANVTCRHAGFLSQDIIHRTVYNTNLSVHSTSFDCRGNELSLLDCKLHNSYCSQYWVGYVNCRAPCEEPETDLIDYNGLPLDNPNPILVGGIIEFCVKGMRNIICDNSWSYFDAMVGCRGLGYSPYGALPTVRHYLSNFPTIPILTNLGCQGNESSLAQCIANNRSTHVYCRSRNIAGLICHSKNITSNCHHGDIRLVGGNNSREGIVEICINNLWGGVCVNAWDTRAANVSCRHAGFLDTDYVAHKNVYNTSLSIHSAGFICQGNELSLLDCEIVSRYCPQYIAGYVACKGPCKEPESDFIGYNGETLDNPTISTNPTLVGGIVEVCVKGVRNVICDNSWSYFDAMVGCRGLGYSPYGALPTGGHYLSYSLNIPAITNLGCHGDEHNLVECIVNNQSRQVRCSSSSFAGLVCHPASVTPNCHHGEIRLVRGNSIAEGVVEICINNLWGRLCPNNWNVLAANVTCRHAGFPSQIALASTQFNYESDNPLHSAYFSCNGNESSLLDCDLIQYQYCYFGNSAYLLCKNVTVPVKNCSHGDIRLRGGSTNYEGRVELCYNGVWIGLCSSYFLREREAATICTQLGLPHRAARPITNGIYYGIADVQIYSLSYFYCSNNESSILECSYNFGGTCDSIYGFGVQCQNEASCTSDNLFLVNSEGKIGTITSFGTFSVDGFLEVCINQTPRPFCDNDFTYHDAAVACKSMGYSPYGAIGSQLYFGSNNYTGSHQPIIHNVECQGNESHFSQCHMSSSGGSLCQLQEAVLLYCQEPSRTSDYCRHGELRLVQQISKSEGIVQICINNVWGYVLTLGLKNSRVVCHQLGLPFTGSYSYPVQIPADNKRLAFVTVLECSGCESNIFDCEIQLAGSSVPWPYEFAAVKCIGEPPVPICKQGQVRLSTGSNETAGRVEVCYDNKWGTIYDFSDWTHNDALVICHQLGLPYTEAKPYTVNRHHSDTTSVALNAISCTGSEKMLLDCTFVPSFFNFTIFGGLPVDLGVHCLGEFVDSCTNGNIRLVNGSTYQGRVEICINNLWYTVCDDGWDDNAATVACRQAGLRNKNAIARTQAFFGKGSGPVLGVHWGCFGNETSLLSCSMSPSTCSHDRDAGVTCEAPCEGNIALLTSNGKKTNDSFGIVAVCVNYVYVPLCDEGWSMANAKVTCKSLGLSPYGAVPFTGQVLLTEANLKIVGAYCTGNEDNYHQCCYTNFTDEACGLAGVQCQSIGTLPNNCSTGDVRLVDGNDSYEGRVEICINYLWYTVCDREWDNADANVVCRQAGIDAKVVIAKRSPISGTGLILGAFFTCFGNESSLLECPFSKAECKHFEDAGVECRVKVCDEGDVRLRNGPTNYQGRVEICHKNEWGTICSNGWDRKDALVTCKQLGYPGSGATAMRNAAYGPGSGPIHYTYVQCDGYESSLKECLYVNDDRDCTHQDDAGVVCDAPCTHGSVSLLDYSGTPILTKDGILRICLNKTQGTICDNSWGYRDASVACNALGYSPYGAIPKTSQGIASYTLLYPLIGDVNCRGDENSLIDCGVTSAYCYNGYFAGVNCKELGAVSDNCTHGSLRLVGGSSINMGRLEICISGMWGTICNRGWRDSDARIACKQMNLTGGGARTMRFGAGSGPVFLSDVVCHGDEKSLLDCYSSTYYVDDENICGHNNDVGIMCEAPCSSGEVVIVDSNGALSTRGTGVLRVCVNRRRGLVCDDGWDYIDASIACKQAGFSSYGAIPQYHKRVRSSANLYPVITNIQCTGQETNFTDCLSNTTDECPQYSIAGVACQDKSVGTDGCTHGSIRLANGLNNMEGRVEICVNGIWGTICDDIWDVREARVTCRQLGNQMGGANLEGTVISSHIYGPGTGPIYFDNMRCTGNEVTLMQCHSNPPGVHNCNHYEDAAVICTVV